MPGIENLVSKDLLGISGNKDENKTIFFFFHLSGCLCVSEREILVRMSNSFLRRWQALQDRRKAYLIIYSLLILK